MTWRDYSSAYGASPSRPSRSGRPSTATTKRGFYNDKAAGLDRLTNTIFYEKSVRLFVFDFGNADDGRSIRNEVSTRMWPSLAVQLPVLLVGLAVYVTFALLMAFFRATYIDFWGVVLCVAMMSISGLFYIIGGQYVFSKIWNLVPISGYSTGGAFKFLVLPVAIGAFAGMVPAHAGTARSSSKKWERITSAPRAPKVSRKRR